jgi:hypothetical protein
MSDREHTATMREMKSLQDAGKAYRQDGSPTAAYGRILDKLEAHINAKADMFEARAAQPTGGPAEGAGGRNHQSPVSPRAETLSEP